MRTSEDSLPRIDPHQRLRNEPLVAELFRSTRPQRVRVTRGGLALRRAVAREMRRVRG